MDTLSEKYLKGFNHAYLLAKNKPELLQQILNTDSLNSYIQGLKDGKLEYEKSRVKSRFKELQKISSQKEKNIDKDLER